MQKYFSTKNNNLGNKSRVLYRLDTSEEIEDQIKKKLEDTPGYGTTTPEDIDQLAVSEREAEALEKKREENIKKTKAADTRKKAEAKRKATEERWAKEHAERRKKMEEESKAAYAKKMVENEKKWKEKKAADARKKTEQEEAKKEAETRKAIEEASARYVASTMARAEKAEPETEEKQATPPPRKKASRLRRWATGVLASVGLLSATSNTALETASSPMPEKGKTVAAKKETKEIDEQKDVLIKIAKVDQDAKLEDDGPLPPTEEMEQKEETVAAAKSQAEKTQTESEKKEKQEKKQELLLGKFKKIFASYIIEEGGSFYGTMKKLFKQAAQNPEDKEELMKALIKKYPELEGVKDDEEEFFKQASMIEGGKRGIKKVGRVFSETYMPDHFWVIGEGEDDEFLLDTDVKKDEGGEFLLDIEEGGVIKHKETTRSARKKAIEERAKKKARSKERKTKMSLEKRKAKQEAGRAKKEAGSKYKQASIGPKRMEAGTIASREKGGEEPVAVNFAQDQDVEKRKQALEKKAVVEQKKIDGEIAKTKAALAKAFGTVMETEQALLVLNRAMGKTATFEEAREVLEKVRETAKSQVPTLKRIFGARKLTSEQKKELQMQIKEIAEEYKAMKVTPAQ